MSGELFVRMTERDQQGDGKIGGEIGIDLLWGVEVTDIWD